MQGQKVSRAKKRRSRKRKVENDTSNETNGLSSRKRKSALSAKRRMGDDYIVDDDEFDMDEDDSDISDIEESSSSKNTKKSKIDDGIDYEALGPIPEDATLYATLNDGSRALIKLKYNTDN